VSVLLRPARLELAPQLSLVGGLATALTVESALGLAAALKWPNDVLIDGRKVAGVLAEGRAGGIVLGIGLNVNQLAAELPDDARTAAISLRAADGRHRDRAVVLAGLLLELERAYDRWSAGGLASLHDEIARRDCLVGREITVGGVSGVAAGIADDGRLLVRSAGELVRVASGEVGDA
jgi:BirA family biotin operon repressor/biotin-[acetyl-CoA-carboxylase] ligase